MRFFVLVAAPIAALALSGCVASATIGAPATPTPATAPTPQPPQVIYVQQPPAAAQPAGMDVILVAVIIGGMTIGAIIAALITYMMGQRDGQQEGASAAHQPYSNAMYQVMLTPAEYGEWAQLQAYKARQIAQANSRWMVKR